MLLLHVNFFFISFRSSSSSNCLLISHLSLSLFSLSLSSLCSLSQSSLLPFLITLASLPSLLFFLSIICPPKIKTSTFIQLVYLAKPLARGYSTLPSPCYYNDFLLLLLSDSFVTQISFTHREIDKYIMCSNVLNIFIIFKACI